MAFDRPDKEPLVSSFLYELLMQVLLVRIEGSATLLERRERTLPAVSPAVEQGYPWATAL
jgi:hypothetical protein